MGFTVLAGDGLRIGKHAEHMATAHLLSLRKDKGGFLGIVGTAHHYKPTDVVEAEEVDAESFRSTGATVGWGLVGLAVAGPLGAGLGAIIGGQKNEKTLAIKLNDGRTFLGVFSAKQARNLTTHLKAKAFEERASA
ncbi:MAG: hypothetical protein AAGC81_02470 [Pseudomonadota bacterium]